MIRDPFAPIRPMAVIEGASLGPPALAPEFVDGFDPGRRFALWVLPGRGVRRIGSVLAVQPFGDEANLSRRVLVAQALRLAERGWATMIVDLYGTGDSDGATGDATLAAWRADLLRASRLARLRQPGRHVLWGTRMGALLAVDALPAIEARVDALVLWQPPESGEAALDSLLRLGKVGALARGGAGAASTGAEGAAGPSPADAANRPPADADDAFAEDVAATSDSAAGTAEAAGRSSGSADGWIDLGGYRLRASLLRELAALRPRAPETIDGRVPCPVLALTLRRVAGAQAQPPAAMLELAREWVARGYPADARVAAAVPFWSSMEPSDPVAAFQATEEFLAELSIDA